MNIRVSHEGARGCGWRKEGGLYLMSGGVMEPCGRLPVEVSTCPTCGQGVKPARGYTWIDPSALVPPLQHGTPNHNRLCPLGADEPGSTISRMGERAGLLWIGGQFYKTVDSFTREAASMGVSRRITAVPRDFVVGETWVLLGHREAIERPCRDCGDKPERTGMLAEHAAEEGESVRVNLGPHSPDPDCLACNGTGFEKRPAIFSAFRPDRIEYVVKGDESEEELESMVKRGIEPVKVERIGEPESLLGEEAA